MSLRLYAANRRTWILVPECMLVPQAALEEYGTLEFLGVVRQDQLGAPELSRIMREFDASSFSEISERLALQLAKSIKNA